PQIVDGGYASEVAAIGPNLETQIAAKIHVRQDRVTNESPAQKPLPQDFLIRVGRRHGSFSPVQLAVSLDWPAVAESVFLGVPSLVPANESKRTATPPTANLLG